MESSDRNKRIALNTVMLYMRMLLILGINLYTSRVILNTLGVEDFGIYNIVGGVVTMLSFLNSSMTSATQRFLSFELGKNNYEKLRKVFSMSVNIHAVIAVVVLILSETLGIWFLNMKLNIPIERMNAANWVFQFSVFSFLVTIFGVPYNATIISREHMKAFAYVSILEVVLKLIIVYALVWFGYDKLKMYAILIFFITALIWIVYKIYCKQNFSETNYYYIKDKSLFKTLMSYAGWNLYGSIAGVTMGQGVNILLNLFFGPLINAARGIAYQVNGAVNGFVSNFQIAMNPQIIKCYATNRREEMFQLIFRGSKYSFFLLVLIALPIFLEAEIILKWWLKIVPDYTVEFCRLVLINTLIDCISGPLMTAAQATGNIKKYQSVVGGLLLLVLPISYLLLKKGYSPQATLYASIIISLLSLFARLMVLRSLIQISIRKFINEVIIRTSVVLFVASILPLLIRLKLDQGFIRFCIVCITSIFITIASIYFFGLSKQEKQFLQMKKVDFINKIYYSLK